MNEAMNDPENAVSEELTRVEKRLTELSETLDEHLDSLAEEAKHQNETLEQISRAIWSLRDYTQLVFPRKS